MGYDVDFSKIESAATPFEANDEARFRARASVAIAFQATRLDKWLGEIFENEDDFVNVAIAKLERGGMGDVEEPIIGASGDVIVKLPKVWVDNVAFVNEALMRSSVRSRVGTSMDELQGALRRTGEYDVALKGLIPIIYRYPHKLRRETYQHVLTKLLNTRGPHDPAVEDVDYASVTAPETENHILMIQSSRCLTNQLLLLEAWRNGAPFNPDFDNDINIARRRLVPGGEAEATWPPMKEWMLRQLQDLLRFDFWEYQSRPYQSYAMAAIQNLCDYAWDPEVKLAARMVLDYVSAKFAVSSSGLRRAAPFRRKREFMNRTEFLGDHADAQTPRFMILAGHLQGLKGRLGGHAHETGVSDMVLAAVTSYRVPDMVLDLMFNRRSYFQRFSHGHRSGVMHRGANGVPGGVEVYASDPLWLISAGGIWMESGYGQDEFNGYEQCAWPLPSLVIPNGAAYDWSDCIRIVGLDVQREAINTGVAPGFLCGMNVVVPDAYLVPERTVREGHWLFVDASGQRDPGAIPGFRIAAFLGDEIVFGILGEHRNRFGFVEIAAAAGSDFDSFRRAILARNAGRTFAFDRLNEYTMSSGRTIRFSAVPDNKYHWGIHSIDGLEFETDVGRWPLAEGDILNSRSDTPGDDGHSGFVRIDNPALAMRLVLDMRNPFIPRRYQYRLDGPRHTSAFAVSADLYRMDVFCVSPGGAVTVVGLDAYANEGRWPPPAPLTPPGEARWNSPVASVARTSEHIDLFWIGPDGAVAGSWWDATANHGAWKAGFPLTPRRAASHSSGLAALATPPDRVDVFWVGPDGAIGTTSWNGAVGTPWEPPIGITPPATVRVDSRVSAVAPIPTRTEVFWVGPDGAIATTWRVLPSSAWASPIRIAPPDSARWDSPVVAVAHSADAVDVFWIGPDGGVRTTWWAGDRPWKPAIGITPPGVARSGSSLSALARMASRLDVFWIGPDGAIVSTACDPADHVWVAPFGITRLGAARTESSLAALARAPDHIDVFWTGPDGALATTWWDGRAADGGWWRDTADKAFPISPPRTATAGPIPRRAISGFLAARGRDRIDLVWRGPNGGLGSTWSDAYHTNGAWVQPFPITPPEAARRGTVVACTTRGTGDADLFWAAVDGAITRISHDLAAGWTPPSGVAPSGASRPDSPVAVVSRSPEQLDVFWIGGNGAIASTNWDVAGNRWVTPFPITLPGAARAGSPLAAVARTAHHLDVFWVDVSGAIATTSWHENDPDGVWLRMPPGPVKITIDKVIRISGAAAARADSPLAAVARTPDRLDVFWIGEDGAIASTWWDARARDGAWVRVESAPIKITRNKAFPLTTARAAGPGSSLVAVARTDDRLDLFWIDPTGAIASSSVQSGAGPWSPGLPITSPATARPDSPLAAMARAEDRLEVFWVRPDGAIGTTWWNRDLPGGDWWIKQGPAPLKISRDKAVAITPAAAAG